MTEAVLAPAALDKALRRSLPAGVIHRSLTPLRRESFSFFSFPQLYIAVMRGRTGLQCLTKISAGYRRNP
jgi:hypothetical protein